MNWNRTLQSLAAIFLCCSFLWAEEFPPLDESVKVVCSFGGSSIIFKSDYDFFKSVIDEIIKADAEIRERATFSIFRFLQGAAIPVKDRVRKINMLFDYIENGKLPLSNRILPRIVSILSTDDNDELAQRAIKLISEKTDIDIKAGGRRGGNFTIRIKVK